MKKEDEREKFSELLEYFNEEKSFDKTVYWIDLEKIKSNPNRLKEIIDKLPDSQFWKTQTFLYRLFPENAQNLFYGHLIKDYFSALTGRESVQYLTVIKPFLTNERRKINALLKDIFFFFTKNGLSFEFNEDGILLVKSYDKEVYNSSDFLKEIKKNFGNTSYCCLFAVLKAIAYLRGGDKIQVSKYSDIADSLSAKFSFTVYNNIFKNALTDLSNRDIDLGNLESIFYNELFKTMFRKTNLSDVEKLWEEERKDKFRELFRFLEEKAQKQFFTELQKKLEEAIIKDEFPTSNRKVWGALLYFNIGMLTQNFSMEAFSKASLIINGYVMGYLNEYKLRKKEQEKFLSQLFLPKVETYASLLFMTDSKPKLPPPQIKKARKHKAKINIL